MPCRHKTGGQEDERGGGEGGGEGDGGGSDGGGEGDGGGSEGGVEGDGGGGFGGKMGCCTSTNRVSSLMPRPLDTAEMTLPVDKLPLRRAFASSEPPCAVNEAVASA